MVVEPKVRNHCNLVGSVRSVLTERDHGPIAPPVERLGLPLPKKPAITADEAQFVEEAGVTYAQLGLPRMAGRIVGWMLICDPPRQSLVDLADVLQASKASISTMTRVLIQLDVLRRVTVPGDRRDYVIMPPPHMPDVMRSQLAKLRQLRELADHGLEALRKAPEARRERLRELRAMYAFLEREMPAILARFEKERPIVKKRK